MKKKLRVKKDIFIIKSGVNYLFFGVQSSSTQGKGLRMTHFQTKINQMHEQT